MTREEAENLVQHLPDHIIGQELSVTADLAGEWGVQLYDERLGNRYFRSDYRQALRELGLDKEQELAEARAIIIHLRNVHVGSLSQMLAQEAIDFLKKYPEDEHGGA